MARKEKTEFNTPMICQQCNSKVDGTLCSIPNLAPFIDRIKITCQFKAGQMVFYAGNDPLGLFTVGRGLIKLESISPTGSAHTLRFVGPGGVLGYRSLFANEPYHANAVAMEDSELCFIAKNEMIKLFQEHPEVAMNLMTYLAKDLKAAEEKWLDQMDKGASQRVAESLLFLQDHFKHQNWTRREIAQWAGTTPETVIRTLAQFEKEGIIDQSDGRSIKIINRDKLSSKKD